MKDPEDPQAAAEERRLAQRAAARLGGLCAQCIHARGIESAKGSLFLLCGQSKHDPRYARYPAQPVVACRGFER